MASLSFHGHKTFTHNMQKVSEVVWECLKQTTIIEKYEESKKLYGSEFDFDF
jgi:hypothetical protein